MILFHYSTTPPLHHFTSPSLHPSPPNPHCLFSSLHQSMSFSLYHSINPPLDLNNTLSIHPSATLSASLLHDSNITFVYLSIRLREWWIGRVMEQSNNKVTEWLSDGVMEWCCGRVIEWLRDGLLEWWSDEAAEYMSDSLTPSLNK